jgi:hypothetical protein
MNRKLLKLTLKRALLLAILAAGSLLSWSQSGIAYVECRHCGCRYYLDFGPYQVCGCFDSAPDVQ